MDIDFCVCMCVSCVCMYVCMYVIRREIVRVCEGPGVRLGTGTDVT